MPQNAVELAALAKEIKKKEKEVTSTGAVLQQLKEEAAETKERIK